MMLMRKETRAAIITIEFGGFYQWFAKSKNRSVPGKVNLTDRIT